MLFSRTGTFAAALISLLFILLCNTQAFAADSVIYDALPNPLPGNAPSQPFQAQQTFEFGDFVHLGGTDRDLTTVTVAMSNWALQATTANVDFCAANTAKCTTDGYIHPITINIYGSHLGANGVPDTLLATSTQDINIPWRPAADPTCPNGGTAWRAPDGACFNGYAFNAVFNLSSLNVTLPNDIIVSLAYNTQTYGVQPIGVDGPYNSLNVLVPNNQPVSVGSDDSVSEVFWNTITAAWYTDKGVSGVGIFRKDTNWTPNGTIAMQIKAKPPATGSIEITKYACPQETTVNRTVNGVGGTPPVGCVLQSGAPFGYVKGNRTDAAGPWEDVNGQIVEAGITDANGVLTIPGLSADGKRYWVSETNGNGGRLGDGDIIGLYCIGDADPNPNHNDNSDITFVPANDTVKCVAYNKAAKVTMCKKDNFGNPLSGWTLILKGKSVEDVIVPTNTTAGVNSSNALSSVKSYIATANGTWTNQGGANPVDAEYSTIDGWATQMDGYTGYQTDILELQINSAFDPNSNWGSYNSSHTYAQSFFGTGAAANFRVFDGSGTTPDSGWYDDNSGTLAVNISEGYAGVTGQDGCVTFDVPFGKYTADEILRDGWKNDSGLGEVIVDELTESFTIVNHQTAELTLVKQVINDNGGEAEATDWTLSAEGLTTITGKTGEESITNAIVEPGTYNLFETELTGYTASAWVCTGNATPVANGNALTLVAGETVVCTITNTFVPPVVTHTVTIYKYIDGKRATEGGPFPIISSVINFVLELANAYEYSVEVPEGDTLTLNEDLTGDKVGRTCKQGAPYALVGYSKGLDEKKAKKNAILPFLKIKDVSKDKTVIVWNKSCCDRDRLSELNNQVKVLTKEISTITKNLIKAKKADKPALIQQLHATIDELGDVLAVLKEVKKKCDNNDHGGGYDHDDDHGHNGSGRR